MSERSCSYKHVRYAVTTPKNPGLISVLPASVFASTFSFKAGCAFLPSLFMSAG